MKKDSLDKKKTIIFFTIEAGLAHITRSLSIAENLSYKGHNVYFTLNKYKRYLAKGSRLKILNIKNFFGDEENFDKQNFDKLKDPKYIYNFVLEELGLLRKIKPDLAVIDYRFSALISCKKLNIPIVWITNTEGLPFNTYLPNLGIPNVIQKLAHPLIQLSILFFKGEYIRPLFKVARMFDLKLGFRDLKKLTFIIPEPEGYLQNNRYALNTHYVGYIGWNGFKNQTPSWLKKVKQDGKIVYLTFGGTGYDSKKLISLSEQLINKGFKVIVSSSNIADPKDFKKDKNLLVEKFLPGPQVCEKVDLVICHGGAGTLFQALAASKPILAVPFNPDQYIHAFRFRELNLGECVTNASIKEVLKIDWQNLLNLGRTVPVSKIVEAVEKLLAQKDSYSKSIRYYKKKFITTDGVEKAAKIIERMIN